MLALLLACTPDPCQPDADPTLDLGTGLDAFESAPEGAAVALVEGNQGGFHIDIAFETTYFDGRDLLTGTLSGEQDGMEVAASNPWFSLQCAEDGESQEATGLRLIFFEGQPQDYVGETVDVRASVTDIRGKTATATRTWTLTF